MKKTVLGRLMKYKNYMKKELKMRKVITAIILTALCVNLFGCASSTPEANSMPSSKETESILASDTSVDADIEEDDDDNNDKTIHVNEEDRWTLEMRAVMEGKKKVCFPIGNREMFVNFQHMDDYGDYSDNNNVVSDNGEYGLLIKTWTSESENYSMKLEEIVDKPKLWQKHISCNNAFYKISIDAHNASFEKESEEKVTIGNKECMKYIGTIQLDADKGTFYAECYTFFVDSTPCYILAVMLNDIKTNIGDKAAMGEKINSIIASAYSKG